MGWAPPPIKGLISTLEAPLWVALLIYAPLDSVCLSTLPILAFQGSPCDNVSWFRLT